MLRSNRGIAFQKIFLYSSITAALVCLILGIINIHPADDKTPDWQFFFIIGGNWLLIGLILSRIFPNTKTIEVSDQKLRVHLGKHQLLVDFNQIESVVPTTSFINSISKLVKFYQINFIPTSHLPKSIYVWVYLSYGKQHSRLIENIKRELKN